MWSAPHFYLLMLSVDKWEMCSFNDECGRAWVFRFIPKDKSYSEWSAQQWLILRLQPYKDIFGDQVFIARNLIMVMGTDVKDVRRLGEEVTWAVQTKSWRLEMGFWRSFVNVGSAFLEELDERWLG
ncbi:hypothetical protein P154DRAFT_521665 [Amniculicola lignicola CBS 123094]|uniref:Uncharacterized protein n=1 Tax=Amniculicola lignicola CBS 123094 TaxID=1392246 RepID=A0A6A5WIE1_9PLEO|nr:hypothetical protein P154DRAFT_521665 [Amniculicola lignicola CBS 123094]